MSRCAIYVDESCKDDHHYLVNGGLIIEHQDVMETLGELFELKKLKGCQDEIKWEKTNNYRYDSYCRIVEKFFALNAQNKIHFHCLVIDQHNLDHHRFNQGLPSVGYSKFIYQLLVSKFGRLYGHYDEIDVFLDEKTTSTPLREFRKILNNGIATRFSFQHRPYKNVRFLSSKASLFLQINDLILGSVATRINKHHEILPNYRKAKSNLSQFVLDNTEINNIMTDSPFGNNKFTVWHFKTRD